MKKLEALEVKSDNCWNRKVGKAEEPTVALEDLAAKFSKSATPRDKGL